LEKIIHQFYGYFQITPFTLILWIRSSPGTGSHQELTLLLQVPGFPMKNTGKLQYQSSFDFHFFHFPLAMTWKRALGELRCFWPLS